jgi:hypothetical protein
MRIIRAASHRIMAWKNGLGRTDEIVIEPDGAGLEDFTLRISMAHVGADGPFSLFDGVDRTLTVLEGGAMDLDFGDGEHVTLTPASQPFAFAGDRPVHARITAPLVDLNVMTRRASHRHHVRRLSFDRTTSLTTTAAMTYVFAMSPCRVDEDGVSERLGAGDTLAADRPGMHLTLTPDNAASVLVIGIDAKTP